MTKKPGEKADAQWDAVEDATELVHEGRYQDALYLLRDIARVDPTNAYAFYFMGVALYEAGQMEPARDAYRAALRAEPGYVGARGSLAAGLAHAAMGERASAQHYLERFLETKPELEAALEARQVLAALKVGDGPLEVE